MTMADIDFELTPWHPTPTHVPEPWMNLAQTLEQEVKGSQRAYIMKVKYDAQRVGNMLRLWGLPWQVVIAGYLWEYEKEMIVQANLDEMDEVLSHIAESNIYCKYIQDENLPPLLTPPYHDIGGLFIAIAIHYQVLKILQEQSNERPYLGKMQSQIESIGRILLNVASRLGMWYFKREIEDLIEQLRSSRKFSEAKQEHERILVQDAKMLDETCCLLIDSYREVMDQHIGVTRSRYSISGTRRRLQDTYSTGTSQQTKLTGFDLITFDVIVPSVEACYAAFGIFSQLGYIQDRVTDLVANPKANGCSHIAFGLILKPRSSYTQHLEWPESYTRVCQLLIATPIMHAINWYGCLYPSCFHLYTKLPQREDILYPSLEQLLKSEEGKVYLTIKEDLTRAQPETRTPIVVYDKNHQSFALPKGATALDFAFAVDSATGEHAVEALVNNRQASLYRILDAGDIVEIRTSNEFQVQDYWLSEKYAITSLARRQIKESLNRRYPYRREYESLHGILERYHFTLTQDDLDRELRFLLKQHRLGSPRTYLKRLHKTGEQPFTLEWAAQQIMRQVAERNESSPIIENRSNWIPVLDMDLTATKKFIHQQRFCNFCHPTYPHDMKIMGRLRKRGGELIVHKATCPHLIDRTKAQQSILLPMIWQPQPPSFLVAFFVIAQDRKGLILELTRRLRKYRCDLISISAKVLTKFGEAQILFTIEAISDKEVLDIWQEVSNIENVTKVEIDASATSANTRDRLQKLRKQETIFTGKTSIEIAWEESMVILQPRNIILKNPFDISRPATAKMFFGRSTETSRMQRELCEGELGKALILYGPRRSGKSSIIKNFLVSKVPSPHWGVHFSLQNSIQHSEDIILMQLANRICDKFCEQFHTSATDWDQFSDNDSQVRFKRVLQCCLAEIQGSRLVLALDEFGGAIDAYENHFLAPRFFTFWKELMSEIPQLSLILALPTNAHTILNSKKFGNAFSFAESLPVMFLDTKSAEQLLIDPLRDQNIEMYPTTVALAVKLTGGNPYFMTLIGQQLIHYLNEEAAKQLITDEDLRLIVDHMLEADFSPNFLYLKREVQKDEELRLLEAIVELSYRSDQTKVQLKKLAARLNWPISITRQHLERLRNGLILQENGPTSNPYYSFTIELVRRWLTRNHWFFAVTTLQ